MYTLWSPGVEDLLTVFTDTKGKKYGQGRIKNYCRQCQ